MMAETYLSQSWLLSHLKEWKYTKGRPVNVSVGASSLQAGEGAVSLVMKT